MTLIFAIAATPALSGIQYLKAVYNGWETYYAPESALDYFTEYRQNLGN